MYDRLSKIVVYGLAMDDLGGPMALQGFRHMFL